MLKRKLCTLFVIGCLFFAGIPGTLAATSESSIVYVARDGSGTFNCDGVSDQVQINQALNLVAGNSQYTTVYLKGPATYVISDPVYIGSNTILTGDSSAVLKLVNNAGWPAFSKSMIQEKASGTHDITISGFVIDGNKGGNPLPTGKGYANLISLNNCVNVAIHDMLFRNGLNDAFKTLSTSNVKFYNNVVTNIGHDGVYFQYGSYLECYGNVMGTKTNSAFRMQQASHGKIHHNEIFAEGGGGAGIDIDSVQPTPTTDIEISYNYIHDLTNVGIWLEVRASSNYAKESATGIHVHHNIITNCGNIPQSYFPGGIMVNGFYDTLIENNVIDGNYGAGIAHVILNRPGYAPVSSGYNTVVRNNIISNTVPHTGIGWAGAGLWNSLSGTHTFDSDNNIIYNNAGGDYLGTSPSASDIHVNPLFASRATGDYHLKSTAGRSDENSWVLDSVMSPGIDAGFKASDYSNEPEDNGDRINIGAYGNTEYASRSGISQQVNRVPVMETIEARTVEEGSTLSFTITASDADGDSLAYSATPLPPGANLGRETGIFSWTPENGFAGSYDISFEVSDGVLTASKEATITVVEEDASIPVSDTMYDNRLKQSAPDSVISGSPYIDIGNIASGASYRDLLWYDLSEYEGNGTDRATLSLFWYYPANTARAQDTVIEVYRPVDWDPGFVTWNNRAAGTSWTNAGGDWFDMNGVAQGSEPYATLTIEGSNIPDNRYYELDVTELVNEYLSGNYENTGFLLKARSEDNNYIAFYSSEAENEDQAPELFVGSATGNSAPVMEAVDARTVEEESELTFTITASDADGDSLTYSATPLPPGANLGRESGIFSWTPENGLEGSYDITFEVSDGVLTASKETTITVVSGESLLPSLMYDNRLRELSPDKVISESPYIDIGNIASGASYRDLLWYDLSEYEGNGTDRATLSLFWYYPANTARAQDTVIEVYRPVDWDPGFVTWNNRAAGTSWTNAGGDWFDKNGNAQGSEPYATLTIEGSNIPDNRYYELDVTELVNEYLSGNSENTGFLLKARSEDNNYIAFYSSEAENEDQAPELYVEPATGNTAPVMEVVEDRTVEEESELTFTITASDVDGDSLAYSATPLPTGANLDQETGIFSWTPEKGFAGSYDITFEVSDGVLTDSKEATITVVSGESLHPSLMYDNRLRELSPDKVISDSPYIDIGNIASGASYRDLLWYDLSEYEGNGTDRATLSLFWYYPANTARAQDTVIEVYRPVDWDPGFVTWNNRASDTSWTNAGGDWFDKNGAAQGSEPYATLTIKGSDIPDNRYYELDVTELVNEYLSGNLENTGFLLKARSEDNNYIAFYSSEAGVQAPELFVE